MKAIDVLGKRVLAKIETGTFRGHDIDEYKILELSPSRQWIKLMNIHGRKFWKETTSVSVVEELKQLEPCPESKKS